MLCHEGHWTHSRRLISLSQKPQKINKFASHKYIKIVTLRRAAVGYWILITAGKFPVEKYMAP